MANEIVNLITPGAILSMLKYLTLRQKTMLGKAIYQYKSN